MKKSGTLLLILIALSLLAYTEETGIRRVEPPNWWTGFSHTQLQLMVYGPNISSNNVNIHQAGIILKKTDKVSNPNYLFLTLDISRAKPGNFLITLEQKGKTNAVYNYTLKARKPNSARRQGFNSSDVIYLLFPDRFANGDPSNDNPPWALEKTDRTNPNGRHGGDLKGILDHLDYLQDLGITAIWINPLLENNQPTYSYHGYSTTDYYMIDPRFGNKEDYIALSDAIHRRGMKLIQDMIFNHCGSYNWWMKDLPSADWINTWPEFTRSTYRAGSISDPYLSENDRDKFVRGWFDQTMPDLNQHNPFLKEYLIQNSIWWIETAGLDGIRQDTHPYPYKDMMAEWASRVMTEYPSFNIVGECWVNYPSSVAYWQKNSRNRDGYNSNLPSVFDFPMYEALKSAFNETDQWNTGIVKLYEVLSQDYVYPDPSDVVVFADNHDVNRYFDSQNDDIRKMKMAMAFILTTRGIPEIYYGTEILMTTGADKGDGMKRKDFPGGWPGDTGNAFTAAGRTPAQNDMFTWLRNLLRWRKSAAVIHSGKLTHFIPADGIYVYFRHNDKQAVMVILNNNEQEKTIDTRRFEEILKKYTPGREITSGQVITDLKKIISPPKSAMIIELNP